MVTDIVFLRKRAAGEPASHADAEWLHVAARLTIDGAEVPINRYFVNHPEMVLGTWSRKDTLYGDEGYSVVGNGDLAEQLKAAIQPLAGIRAVRRRSTGSQNRRLARTPSPRRR